MTSFLHRTGTGGINRRRTELHHRNTGELAAALEEEERELAEALQVYGGVGESGAQHHHGHAEHFYSHGRQLEGEFIREGTRSSEESSLHHTVAYQRGFIRTRLEEEVDSHKHIVSHFAVDESELIETMGVSGLSIIAKGQGFRERCSLVSISLQAFFVQYMILYSMWKYIQDKRDVSQSDPVPVRKSLLMVALYLHFMNLMKDLPFGISLMCNFRELHHSWKEMIITAPIMFVDAIVTPLITLVLGSLFLCTSPTAADVLLNSCACAFVSGIDNLVVSLSRTMGEIAGTGQNQTIFLPYQARMVTCLDFTVVLFPVIPVLFAYTMVSIGLDSHAPF